MQPRILRGCPQERENCWKTHTFPGLVFNDPVVGVFLGVSDGEVITWL